MMEQHSYTVLENSCIARDVYRMLLGGPTEAFTAPGQFLDLRLDGFYLRRPISLCDLQPVGPVIVYKVVGHGTAALAQIKTGAQLDALVGLGNGFDLTKGGDAPLLVGGGVGTPPLYYLARRLREAGRQVQVALGFQSAADAFLCAEFRALGCTLHVATADGSLGQQGLVTDVLPPEAGYVYACGPLPMLRAVAAAMACDGQYSFEERMGCGFGACMGCSCETKNGPKRICKEGPVLEKGEILW